MNMTLPPYTPPPVTGITFSSGTAQPQALPPNSLCTRANAMIVQKFLGGTLVNAQDYPALNMNFVGLDPASPNQPWYLIDVPNPGFVGPDVVTMYAANDVNGGGIGNKGTLAVQDGKVVWTPTSPTPPAPAPKPDSSGDAAAFLEAQGGGGPTLAQVSAKLDRILGFFRIP